MYPISKLLVFALELIFSSWDYAWSGRTIDFVANALISLMALGARFLKVTP